MAWSVGNSNSVSGAGTYTLAVTAGQLIITFVTLAGSGASVTCSDNVNGSYGAPVIQLDSDRPVTMAIFSKIATTTTTVTITNGGSVGVDQGHACAFSNNAGTIPATVNATASAISAAAVNLITTAAGCLVVGFNDASTSDAPGVAFTQIATIVNSARCLSEYQTSLSSANGSNIVSMFAGIGRGIIAAAFDAPPPPPSVYLPSDPLFLAAAL